MYYCVIIGFIIVLRENKNLQDKITERTNAEKKLEDAKQMTFKEEYALLLYKNVQMQKEINDYIQKKDILLKEYTELKNKKNNTKESIKRLSEKKKEVDETIFILNKYKEEKNQLELEIESKRKEQQHLEKKYFELTQSYSDLSSEIEQLKAIKEKHENNAVTEEKFEAKIQKLAIMERKIISSAEKIYGGPFILEKKRELILFRR